MIIRKHEMVGIDADQVRRGRQPETAFLQQFALK
jgi:hypothetical protein